MPWTDVLYVLTSQEMPVINRDSNNNNNNNKNNNNNNNNNNNGENLSYLRNEFETLKTFLIEELYHLKEQVKKLNIKEVNFEKDRYNDILSVGSFTII